MSRFAPRCSRTGPASPKRSAAPAPRCSLAQIHCEVSGEVARILGLPRHGNRAAAHFRKLGRQRAARTARPGTGAGRRVDRHARGRSRRIQPHVRHRASDRMDRATRGRTPSGRARRGGRARCRALARGARSPVARRSMPHWPRPIWRDLRRIDRGRHRSETPVDDRILAFGRRDGGRVLRAPVAGCGRARARLPRRADSWHRQGRGAERRVEPADAAACKRMGKVRLVPYWTERAGRQTGALGEAAVLASYAYERQDGSGYFRGVRDAALTLEARVLAASLAWVALRSARPWRAALDDGRRRPPGRSGARPAMRRRGRGTRHGWRACGPAHGRSRVARRLAPVATGNRRPAGHLPRGEQQAGRAGAR